MQSKHEITIATQYNSIQYNTILRSANQKQLNTILYNTTQYNNIPINTINNNTIQNNTDNTIQTIQYKTIQIQCQNKKLYKSQLEHTCWSTQLHTLAAYDADAQTPWPWLHQPARAPSTTCQHQRRQARASVCSMRCTSRESTSLRWTLYDWFVILWVFFELC